ncbi:transcriptional repressor NrdR [Striga asiatica]|uniref:Transcriptional repressor NrdR n=1 Tax=Striga asiatica TaxID=4170 RepID=A0A5A7P8D9_STRAF|nr:transcriptional repressor NrdR [Striga asiatica]
MTIHLLLRSILVTPKEIFVFHKDMPPRLFTRKDGFGTSRSAPKSRWVPTGHIPKTIGLVDSEITHLVNNNKSEIHGSPSQQKAFFQKANSADQRRRVHHPRMIEFHVGPYDYRARNLCISTRHKPVTLLPITELQVECRQGHGSRDGHYHRHLRATVPCNPRNLGMRNVGHC